MWILFNFVAIRKLHNSTNGMQHVWWLLLTLTNFVYLYWNNRMRCSWKLKYTNKNFAKLKLCWSLRWFSAVYISYECGDDVRYFCYLHINIHILYRCNGWAGGSVAIYSVPPSVANIIHLQICLTQSISIWSNLSCQLLLISTERNVNVSLSVRTKSNLLKEPNTKL